MWSLILSDYLNTKDGYLVDWLFKWLKLAALYFSRLFDCYLCSRFFLSSIPPPLLILDTPWPKVGKPHSLRIHVHVYLWKIPCDIDLGNHTVCFCVLFLDRRPQANECSNWICFLGHYRFKMSFVVSFRIGLLTNNGKRVFVFLWSHLSKNNVFPQKLRELDQQKTRKQTIWKTSKVVLNPPKTRLELTEPKQTTKIADADGNWRHVIQKGVKTLIEQHMQPVLLDPSHRASGQAILLCWTRHSQGQWTGNTAMMDPSQTGISWFPYIETIKLYCIVLYCIVSCYDGPVTDRASRQTTLLCVCVCVCFLECVCGYRCGSVCIYYV